MALSALRMRYASRPHDLLARVTGNLTPVMALLPCARAEAYRSFGQQSSCDLAASGVTLRAAGRRDLCARGHRHVENRPAGRYTVASVHVRGDNSDPPMHKIACKIAPSVQSGSA
jgi:hypothetical protein